MARTYKIQFWEKLINYFKFFKKTFINFIMSNKGKPLGNKIKQELELGEIIEEKDLDYELDEYLNGNYFKMKIKKTKSEKSKEFIEKILCSGKNHKLPRYWEIPKIRNPEHKMNYYKNSKYERNRHGSSKYERNRHGSSKYERNRYGIENPRHLEIRERNRHGSSKYEINRHGIENPRHLEIRERNSRYKRNYCEIENLRHLENREENSRFKKKYYVSKERTFHSYRIGDSRYKRNRENYEDFIPFNTKKERENDDTFGEKSRLKKMKLQNKIIILKDGSGIIPDPSYFCGVKSKYDEFNNPLVCRVNNPFEALNCHCKGFKPCKFYMDGSCFRKNKCKFVHANIPSWEEL